MRQPSVSTVVRSKDRCVRQILQGCNHRHGRVALQVTVFILIIIGVSGSCRREHIYLYRFIRFYIQGVVVLITTQRGFDHEDRIV